MTIKKVGNSFEEIYTKDFIERMKEENKIFNLEPKNREELKRYVDKVLSVNILKNNNKHYLSLGIEEFIKIIKISKKTTFDMLKNRQLGNVKIGKYRLIIFCIEDYSKYKVSDVREMIKIPTKNLEYRLACNFDNASILNAILYKYEHNLHINN